VTSASIPQWEVRVAWALRGVLVITAVAFIAKGQWAFGAFCIAAVGVAVAPTIAARTAHFVWPIELELVLLWLATAHITLGYLFNFYESISKFDKALHFTDSALLGFIAFLAVYVAHLLRQDGSHKWLDGIAIFLITLGLGAAWEIFEFASDSLIGTHTQGAPDMAPLPDTMWDLIVDGCGGVVAAIFGPLWMNYSRRSRRRVAQLAERLRDRSTAEK
jgi:hypothetical protein